MPFLGSMDVRDQFCFRVVCFFVSSGKCNKLCFSVTKPSCFWNILNTYFYIECKMLWTLFLMSNVPFISLHSLQSRFLHFFQLSCSNHSSIFWFFRASILYHVKSRIFSDLSSVVSQATISIDDDCCPASVLELLSSLPISSPLHVYVLPTVTLSLILLYEWRTSILLDRLPIFNHSFSASHLPVRL